MEVPVNTLRAGLVRRPPAAAARAALGVLALLSCLGACAVTDPNPAGRTAASLQTPYGTVVVDLADAQAMMQALRNFLDTDPSVKTIPMRDPASAAWLRPADTPFVDSQGSLRIGLWRLQARGDALVLTYREPGMPAGKVGYQYVATVDRDTRNRWLVSGIAWEKPLAR